jgi:hypothetical protein
MKKIIPIMLLLLVFVGCTKDNCYVVLDSNNHELCAKCFHTIAERTAWMLADTAKSPQDQCK